MKMTKPEIDVLASIRSGPRSFGADHAPASAVSLAGYATLAVERFGAHRLTITPEGSAWLAAYRRSGAPAASARTSGAAAAAGVAASPPPTPAPKKTRRSKRKPKP